MGGPSGNMLREFEVAELLPNWRQTILSRDEYFHLYPAPDADGWIEWNGGECPVGENISGDIKLACGEKFDTIDMAMWNWRLGNENPRRIIAYRPHKIKIAPAAQEPKPAPEPEAKPSIEQLAADYRNRKDYADRKQQEADAAKADAEAKLAELVAAGKALGLVLSVSTTEPELDITDWRDLRVGDVISVQCFEKVYSRSTVLAVGVSDVLIKNHVGVRKTVNLDERDWSFTSRPAKGDTNA